MRPILVIAIGLITLSVILSLKLLVFAGTQTDATFVGPVQPDMQTTTATPRTITVKEIQIEGKPKSNTTQSGLQAFLLFIIKVFDALLEPVLIAFGYVFMRKFGLNVERETIEWVVVKSTGYAEQKAKEAFKSGKPLSGPETLKVALEQGNQFLIEKRLAKKWGDRLADLIESKLGEIELAKGKKNTVTNATVTEG